MAEGVPAFADACPNWPARLPSRFAAIFAVFASAFRDGGGGSTPNASANAGVLRDVHAHAYEIDMATLARLSIAASTDHPPKPLYLRSADAKPPTRRISLFDAVS